MSATVALACRLVLVYRRRRGWLAVENADMTFRRFRDGIVVTETITTTLAGSSVRLPTIIDRREWVHAEA